MNTNSTTDAATATIIETESTTDLLIRRDFTHQNELVWKCFSDETLVTQWMLGPPGWEKVHNEMNFQVGASFRWKWENPSDNSAIEITGTYQNIETCGLIQNSETVHLGPGIEKHSNVSIRFNEISTGTRIETIIKYNSTADRDAALTMGLVDVMEMGYQQIEQILNKQ